LQNLSATSSLESSVEENQAVFGENGCSLKTLILSGNMKLERIPSMYLLQNLEKLLVNDTAITDLSFLTSELKRLVYLDASDCQISSFECVQGLKVLPKLSFLCMSGNAIEVVMEYRCKLIAYATWNSVDRKKRKLILDNLAVKISEMRTADVIAAIEECDTEADLT